MLGYQSCLPPLPGARLPQWLVGRFVVLRSRNQAAPEQRHYFCGPLAVAATGPIHVCRSLVAVAHPVPCFGSSAARPFIRPVGRQPSVQLVRCCRFRLLYPSVVCWP